MVHDTKLRAAAQAIYDSCYPGEEWTSLPFAVAEKHASVHYRQAVEAALHARSMFAASGEQLPLFERA